MTDFYPKCASPLPGGSGEFLEGKNVVFKLIPLSYSAEVVCPPPLSTSFTFPCPWHENLTCNIKAEGKRRQGDKDLSLYCVRRELQIESSRVEVFLTNLLICSSPLAMQHTRSPWVGCQEGHIAAHTSGGPSTFLPAWLPAPLLPPAQTAILLSPLTVAAAIIFLGCALWKDAKTVVCFSGSDRQFFLINGIFITALWSHFTEYLHFAPFSKSSFIPSGLILPLLISQEKGLRPFSLQFDRWSLKVWEKMPCSWKS